MEGDWINEVPKIELLEFGQTGTVNRVLPWRSAVQNFIEALKENLSWGA